MKKMFSGVMLENFSRSFLALAAAGAIPLLPVQSQEVVFSAFPVPATPAIWTQLGVEGTVHVALTLGPTGTIIEAKTKSIDFPYGRYTDAQMKEIFSSMRASIKTALPKWKVAVGPETQPGTVIERSISFTPPSIKTQQRSAATGVQTGLKSRSSTVAKLASSKSGGYPAQVKAAHDLVEAKFGSISDELFDEASSRFVFHIVQDGLPVRVEVIPQPVDSITNLTINKFLPHKPYPTKGLCPSNLIVNYSQSNERYLNNFDDNFLGAFNLASDDESEEDILLAYRSCLERAISEIELASDIVLTGKEAARDCDTCKIGLSPLSIAYPRLVAIRGLTYLVPTTVQMQDWPKAANGLRNSAVALVNMQRRYQDEARSFHAERLSRFNRNASQARLGQAIGGLLSLGLGSKLLGIDPTLIQQSNLRRQDELNSQILLGRTILDKTAPLLFSNPPIGRWEDDGIRVTIPRYSAETQDPRLLGSNLGVGDLRPLGALSNKFILEKIVRIKSEGGYCTGTIVGPRIILTNRHCVFDDKGNALTYFSVESQSIKILGSNFFDNDTSRIDESGWSKSAIKFVTTEKSHITDPSNDWAFLIMPERSGAFEIFASILDPAKTATMTNLRVAVAGYSSDLNSGSQITMDWGCRANWKSGVLLHQCRTWKGASGSPIVAVDGHARRTRILGVHAVGTGLPGTAGTRYGAASSELYATYVKLRESQKDEESK